MTAKILHILTVIIYLSAFLLAASYFIPAEAAWAPWDAWQGYYEANGDYAAGFNVGLVETFPFAVGAVVLVALILLRWPKICIATLSLFSATWILSLAYGVSGIVWRPSAYRFPWLWAILAVLLVPSLVFYLVSVVRKREHGVAIITFAMILAACSVLYQSCSIAWYLLEDGLLLNVGSVTGMTSAMTLFVALLIRRQLSVETSSQSPQEAPMRAAP